MDLIDDLLIRICKIKVIRQKTLCSVCKRWQTVLEAGQYKLHPLSNFSINTIDNHIQQKLYAIDWSHIPINFKLSWQFMDKYIQFISPAKLMCYQKLTPEFIIKHMGQLRCDKLFAQDIGHIPAKVAKKYICNISFEVICDYTKFSEKSIRKIMYQPYFNWRVISETQNLSESFIEEFKKDVCWPFISHYQSLSEEFIEKWANKLIYENSKIWTHQKLSEAFLNRHIEAIDWTAISFSQKLSETFIDAHADKLNWLAISENQDISEDFIEMYWSKIWWKRLPITTRTFSAEFLARHAEKFKFANPQ